MPSRESENLKIQCRAVWEDEEFVSPHNLGTGRMLVGDLEAQGDRRNPQANW